MRLCKDERLQYSQEGLQLLLQYCKMTRVQTENNLRMKVKF